ncbi:uncharacterized protein [Antedon mediterranea]|uniref:uncharacterized protein n=1 Tax=Antedon mediterranea TaxID=105859 RepID=UPI003AF8993A
MLMVKLEKWLNNQLKEKEQFSLSNCVIVTEFVKYSSHGETSDKLQITLQKRKLGGGDVHKVIYPFGNSEDKALSIFDESEVASSLIKAKMILKISPFKIRPPDKAFTLEFGKVAHLLDPTLSSKIFKTLKVNGEYLDDGQLVLYNKADGDKVIEYVTEQLEQSLASSVDQATTTTTSSNIGVKEVAGISNESTTEFSGILDVTNINAEKVLEASQDTSRKYNVLISPKEIVVVGNKENVDNAMTYFQRLCWVSQLTKHGELNISRPRGDDGMILSDVKFVLPGGITVTVRQGDITEENVDVIVNAANGQLQHGSGVARAIADKAGRRIHEEGQWKLKRRQGPLNVTEVLHTAGYNLNGTYVIHAVGPRRNEYKNKDEFVQCLERTFLNCLEYADAELEARSIAIPLISSGIFGGNKVESAQSLLNSILRFVKNGKHRASTIKEIHLVNIDVEATSEIQDVFNKWQQSGKKTEVEECPICLDVLTEPVKTLQCGHMFCSNCIDDELKHRKVCPMCRGNVKVLKGNQTPAKKDEVEECPICFDVLTETVKKQLQCGHKFCRNCIDIALQHRNACPICGIILGVLKGNQPPGRMTVNYSPMKLPGYPRCGSIAIVYNIPTGIQTREHPNPGLYYQGTGRTAYLPDNQEGRHVAGLLQKAFDARLIFTIGTSITSGTQNAVIWNDIHHKTSISGEPYGYPDPTYLSRVREELAAKGIK